MYDTYHWNVCMMPARNREREVLESDEFNSWSTVRCPFPHCAPFDILVSYVSVIWLFVYLYKFFCGMIISSHYITKHRLFPIAVILLLMSWFENIFLFCVWSDQYNVSYRQKQSCVCCVVCIKCPSIFEHLFSLPSKVFPNINNSSNSKLPLSLSYVLLYPHTPQFLWR